MDGFIDVSHVFINDITIRQLSFYDLKKRTKCYLIFYCYFIFIFPLSSTHPRFRNRNADLDKG